MDGTKKNKCVSYDEKISHFNHTTNCYTSPTHTLEQKNIKKLETTPYTHFSYMMFCVININHNTMIEIYMFIELSWFIIKQN